MVMVKMKDKGNKNLFLYHLTCADRVLAVEKINDNHSFRHQYFVCQNDMNT